MIIPTTLQTIPPFDLLDRQVLLEVAASYKPITFQAGESMLRIGNSIIGSGILISGEAEQVTWDRSGHALVCGAVVPGQIFGVTAFLNNGTPLVDVISCGETRCLWQEKDLFAKMMNNNAPVREFFYQTAASRIRDACKAIQNDTAESIGKGYPPAIRKAVSFIETNYAQRITLENVASECGMSRYHFSRTFKAHMGCGFKPYLNRIRVEKACRLMDEGGKNVTEACFLVGFNDLSYFSRKFKSVYGITPSKFRKAGHGGQL